ncbi:MAG TPA: SCO family protein [Acidisoma sp.]|uniref:SCO family protein n=1 Tax=Acidisoma sp. TaxID=1872115 RepID=UPI002B87431D|nr:SCO family protein [Acidisoma sp.]HTI02508.1 SCO family protein [Acidisoma sp.]
MTRWARRALLSVAFGATLGLLAQGASAAVIGGPFALTDARTGKTVTDVDLRGGWLLLYFGYTFCPDVCPTDLQKIIAARGALGADGRALTPVFVTVDPARDTVPVMARYVALFSPDLMGLTGSQAEIDRIVGEYRVYVAKQAVPGGGGAYLVNHSTFLYLVDPRGKVAEILPASLTPVALARRVRTAMGAPDQG